MTDKELERAVNTCGKNFLAFHIEDITKHYDELAPRGSQFKDRRIRQYYRDQHGFYSKDEAGIRVRLNAVLRIIRSGRARDALESVLTDDPRILPEARAAAQKLLDRGF